MMPPDWKGWVRSLVNGRIASVIRYAQVTVNTASGDGDAVAGNQTTEDEAPGGYQYTVRRLWPFGIRSRPPAGVDAAIVHAMGGATQGMMVGAESPEYGPDDLQDGEVCIYAKRAGARIKIDVDGKITITSTTGQPIEITSDAQVTISGGPLVDINGTSITCGPVGSIPVLVDGSLDSMGVPVRQLPACTNALKAG